jgi:hypothetical protein
VVVALVVPEPDVLSFLSAQPANENITAKRAQISIAAFIFMIYHFLSIV